MLLWSTEKQATLVGLTSTTLPMGIYILLLLWSAKIGRSTVLFSIILLISAFQLVLLSLYGRSVIAVDMFLNVTTTNLSEVRELLSNMLSTIMIVVVLYGVPITLGVIGWTKSWRLSPTMIYDGRRFGYSLISIGLIALGFCFIAYPNFRISKSIFPINAGYNCYLAIDRTIKTIKYRELSARFEFDATETGRKSDREVYILVVGETSRADNWQLVGYERATNPKLSQIKGVTTFPRTLSQSNTTHKSVPMLLSHINAENFEDSIYRVKSVITAFKEVGYRTAFYSNQKRNHSFIDYFGEEADTCVFIKDACIGNPYDSELLPLLKKELERNEKKQLIVLHTYGSHFCYKDRYPETESTFKPDNRIDATLDNRPNLINSYDNSILYTDKLLAQIIEFMESDSITGALIYTSDHGEDIFDDHNHNFLHASSIPSYRQLHVPFIVWTSDRYSMTYPEKCESLHRNSERIVCSSIAYFNTALDLAGISTIVSSKKNSVASREYCPSRFSYLSDHNIAESINEIGMYKEDILSIDSLLRSEIMALATHDF